ncbi:hypothetical protein TWF696_003017 [Orbilia brochopaga]|uniref:Peptidase S54 rhomboid domain-containing protein n=1 Tax=Orbilia brochopaga TaxID=3140254 RepID=A0AAV9U2Y5_9PEZI
MNASVALRLASRLASRPCVCAARPPALGLIHSLLRPTAPFRPASRIDLTTLRFASSHRTRTERTRKSPSLPAPSSPTPSIARPATLTGAEREPIRYTDFLRPAPSSSPESDTPPPPPPPSPTEKATSRFVVLIGFIYAAIYLLSWTPQLSGYAHSSGDLPPQEIFTKYVKPWHEWTMRWFTFSPSIAFERLGYYASQGLPSSDSNDPLLTKITQFILPAFSHVEMWHLAFNFFGLQALAPTMVRYYGFNRSLLIYLITGSLGLLFILPFDRLVNPYTDLPAGVAASRYRATDGRVIREQTKALPTKAQTEEHFYLGQHCRPMLGGSGALYGMLGIAAIVNPGAQFQIMFIPIAISVRTLFMALTAGNVVGFGLRNETFGTVGHLTGAVAGVLLWALWLRRVKLPKEVQRQLMMRLRRRHLGLGD